MGSVKTKTADKLGFSGGTLYNYLEKVTRRYEFIGRLNSTRKKKFNIHKDLVFSGYLSTA